MENHCYWTFEFRLILNRMIHDVIKYGMANENWPWILLNHSEPITNEYVFMIPFSKFGKMPEKLKLNFHHPKASRII